VSSFCLHPSFIVDPVVKPVLLEVIESAQLLKQEKKITSKNLALVLVHDLLFSKGIQAGDGPLKQAILRHKFGAVSRRDNVADDRPLAEHVYTAS
jgi:hypothetical protein